MIVDTIFVDHIDFAKIKEYYRGDFKFKKKLDHIVKDQIMEFFRGNNYVFIWSPTYIPRIDPTMINN